MERSLQARCALAVLLSSVGGGVTACDTPDSTYAVVANHYPLPADASLPIVDGAATPFHTGPADTSPVDTSPGDPGLADGGFAAPQTVVYRAWYSVTYFGEPVPAESSSDPHLVVTTTDTAYAVLAPGWDSWSGIAPRVLIPIQSHGKLTVARGTTLQIVVSDTTFDGNCAAGHPLAQSQADLITRSIFPDEFAGYTYDAASCVLTRAAVDGGVDSGGGADGPESSTGGPPDAPARASDGEASPG